MWRIGADYRAWYIIAKCDGQISKGNRADVLHELLQEGGEHEAHPRPFLFSAPVAASEIQAIALMSFVAVLWDVCVSCNMRRCTFCSFIQSIVSCRFPMVRSPVVLKVATRIGLS